MRPDIELNSLALSTRKSFGEDGYSPLDIFASVSMLLDRKITMVFYPLSSRLSGMCTRVNEHIIICLNSGASYGRQRFTLAHELYHILYEENFQRVICDMKLGSNKSDSEMEADTFASYLLMPYDALHQYAEQRKEWSLEQVVEVEQFFQISHQAMLLRLLKENYITKAQFEEYRMVSVTREAVRLGYSGELYMPAPEHRSYFTTGDYIRKVEALAQNAVISSGKREELLMDVFRADIVYNLTREGMDMDEG